MRAASALLLCGVIAACGSSGNDPTQVMVLVDAESQVRARARDVEFEVRSGQGGDIDDWEVRLKRSITPGSGDVEWPLEVALVPRAGDADRVYLAIATALDGEGQPISEVRAISGYQNGKVVSLLLLFEDSCVGTSDRCDDDQTCRGGVCVDARVDRALLPPYQRDDDGKPVAIPFWSDAGGVADAGADAAADAGDAAIADGGADGSPDAAPPARCQRARDCDDGDACNGAETCEAGRCAAGEPFACDELDDPCRANVCVNDDGEARCEAQGANEGESCREGDDTREPSATCSRDYECRDGECVAQTVDSCEADGMCEQLAGCDPDDGCVLAPKGDGVECDDGDPCTVDDQCNESDFVCAGAPMDCADSVGCTDDICVDGECRSTANNRNCVKPCQVGTCDATLDCQYAPAQDFGTCDDQRGTTTPDFCYAGACVGASRGAPTASCEFGGCGCSGFAAMKDLLYYNDKYIGLIDANRSAPCAAGPITQVYDVTLTELTSYGNDAPNGALGQRGWDLDYFYVVADSVIGKLNTTNRTIDWLNHNLSTGLATGTPAITNFRGATRHNEGQLVGGTANVWFWGSDTTTTSTARLVRCSWTTCLNLGGGCPEPTITCVYEQAYAASSYASAVAYQQSISSGLSNAYGGVVVAVNHSDSTRSIMSDGTNKDYTPGSLEREDLDGTWRDGLPLDQGRMLFLGNGGNNLMVCDDRDFNGDADCTVITGLPNQAQRWYHDGATTPTGGIVLLATSCLSVCISATSYLVALAPGLDPTVGSNWKEFAIASSGPIGGSTFANQVAAGATTIMVLGTQASAPYVIHFAP